MKKRQTVKLENEMKWLFDSQISASRTRRNRSMSPKAIAIFILCIGCVLTALVFPSSALADKDIPTLAPSSIFIGSQPLLTATAIVPTQVGYCQNFNIHITLINYGNATAKNVHLFCRQSPAGFFSLENVDQFSRYIDGNNVDITLGDLDLNAQKDININFHIPLQNDLKADWTRKFVFDFTSSFADNFEQSMGRIIFLAGNGKIVVEKIGFRQQ